MFSFFYVVYVDSILLSSLKSYGKHLFWENMLNWPSCGEEEAERRPDVGTSVRFPLLLLLVLLLLLLLSHFSRVRSVRPHRRQPTRLHRPWDPPGKNIGVDCHFLFQRMKVKSEREVTQSCLILSDPMDCSLPGSSIHGIFQARVLEWGAIAFSESMF